MGNDIGNYLTLVMVSQPISDLGCVAIYRKIYTRIVNFQDILYFKTYY